MGNLKIILITTLIVTLRPRELKHARQSPPEDLATALKMIQEDSGQILGFTIITAECSENPLHYTLQFWSLLGPLTVLSLGSARFAQGVACCSRDVRSGAETRFAYGVPFIVIDLGPRTTEAI